AQQKIDSQLLYADAMRRGVPVAAGTPTQRVELDWDKEGRVLVDIQADVSGDLLRLIGSMGGSVVNSFVEYHAIRAAVPLEAVEKLAGDGRVKFIAPAVRGQGAAVDSEGDYTHAAKAARATFGATGAGVKVGVLSDSVDHLTGSQIDGLVTVISGQGGSGEGEGTAMLEIVHDLAPGAQLYFATANGGTANFANNIHQLQVAGCNVIVDDYEYFNESPFQDATVAQAANTATAAGVLYFSAAMNSGNADDGTSGTWEGDFLDGGAVGSPVSGIESGRVHSFGSAIYDTVLGTGPGGSDLHADLFWSDPLGGSANDYDLFVLDSTGSSVVASSTNPQTGTQDPYEIVSSTSAGERLVVVRRSGAGRFLHLDAGRGLLSIATAGSTRGHDCATNAFDVAAVDAADAYPNPFTGGSQDPVETFSSDGPRHVFYQANGTAITPGNVSSTGGAIRQKPEITATDGVQTDVPGFAPFYGTSAAAPHAAAIAALMKSYNPSLTMAQVRAIFTNTALDIMGLGPDRDSGAGLIMAPAVLQASLPDALQITPGAGITASGPYQGPFAAASQTLTLTNIGAATFNWSLTNPATWLKASVASGTLSPGGAAAVVTISLNTTNATNLAAGVYFANVQFSNQTSHAVQSRYFLMMLQPPVAQAFYP